MKSASIKTRIILIISLVLLIFFAWQGFSQFNSQMNTTQKTEMAEATMLKNAVNSQISDLEDSTKIGMLTVADNPLVQELFAKRDRKALLDLLMPAYKSIEADIKQFQFHLPDSSSFLRLHKPEKYGDSLKSFRFTVNDANAQKTTIVGLEKGVAGYGLRVVAPVSYNGIHLGTVEYGRAFGEGFLQKLKNNYGGDFTLYAFKENKAEYEQIASTIENDEYYIDEKKLETMENEQASFFVGVDKKHRFGLIPLHDYKGELVGFIKSINDRSTIVDSQKQMLISTVVMNLIQLTLMIAILWFVIGIALKKINPLIYSLSQISTGDFSNDIENESSDEIGQIGNNVNKMLESLRILIANVKASAGQVENQSSKINAVLRELASAGTEISKAVEDLAIGAANQSTKILKSNKVTEELSEDIGDVESKVGSIASGAVEMGEKTQLGIEALENVRVQYDAERESSEKLARDMDELKKMSENIDAIVETISSISESTNLLSLNASIEAARAGEQGRGFAVVADEIGKLAKQSGESTENVSEIIAQIQRMIVEVLSSMDESKRIRERAGKAVEDAEDKYKSIKISVDSVIKETKSSTEQLAKMIKVKDVLSENLNEIALLSEQSSAASQEMTASIEEISANIDGAAGAMQEMTNTVQDLRTAVSTFKLE